MMTESSKKTRQAGDSTIATGTAAAAPFRLVVLKLERPSESPGRLVEPQVVGPTPTVSDSVGLQGRGSGPRICIFSNSG